MSEMITCPRCRRLVLPQNRYCEHCGVDLTVATIVAEQAIVLPAQMPVDGPLAPEILVPRIGEYLMQKGELTADDLQRALAYQDQSAAAGKPILIGQALLALDLIGRETLDQVITTQILKLQTALNETNQYLQQRVDERTIELQNALERLSELNHLKSNFIANISHELRTPLTHIKGYLDLLSDDGLGPLNDAQTEAVQVLRRAERRLENLIEDLIQFSLASRGELTITPQAIDIDKLIQVTVDRAKQKARDKRIKLGTEVEQNLPKVYADDDKIGWVLLQLLDNALKFTPEGGEVIVEAIEKNDLVTIAVIDRGIGIPADRIDEIFEPFHQLDSSMTRRYGGTGLGLAMVRRIIEAHGFEIRIESLVHEGSRFEFSLPPISGDKET